MATVFRSSELLATAHAATQSSDDSTEFRNNLLEAITSLTEFDTELMDCTTSGLYAERILANFRAIRVCNIYRTLRIIVNESLLQCTRKLPRERLVINVYQVRQESSLRIIEEMSRQVLATVPTCLGTDGNLHWQFSSTRASVGRAYFLLWPLDVIHKCPYVEDLQRGCVQDVLIFIGNYFGLKHALELIQVTPARLGV